MKYNSIVILGAGSSGIAAARLAKTVADKVVLLDTGNVEIPEIEGVETVTGNGALEKDYAADLVIFSPGVPVDAPLALKYKGVPDISELAFGASFLKCPIIAVTGTNGKTTTVEMLEHLLKEKGAIACGNIGLPVSEVAMMERQPEIAVLEVSSFQMEHPGNFSPNAAALLNISPDHLVRHYTMENYIAAKLSIFGKNTISVINKTTLQIKQVSDSLNKMRCLSFSSCEGDEADFSILEGNIRYKGKDLLKLSDLPFSGVHNYENALAALALCQAAGIEAESVAEGLKSFSTGAHRLETILKRDGLEYIDDSKATNVDALICALKALSARKRPIALIAGGLDKSCSLDEAIPYVNRYVSYVSLIGKCRERLLNNWGDIVPARLADSMEEAVRQCRNSLVNTNGIVLLSPACASQDMFLSYADRGEAFRKACLSMD